MKYFLQAFLSAYFAAALANSFVKPAKSNHEVQKLFYDMINNYYAGSNCSEKVKQQLAQAEQDIKVLKDNVTKFSCGKICSGLMQQVIELQKESKEVRENLTEVKQQLTELKEEVKAMKENQTKVYNNCAEAYKSGNKISGVYKIDPDGLGEFEVFCDQKTAGGGWTVFQKRFDGSVDFYRGWDDYKRGFGNLNGEFWLELDKIHRLTVSSSNKLRVDLADVPGNSKFTEYSSFAVGKEKDKYKLRLGRGHSGTAGDSLGNHRGYPFTTKDRDNDRRSSANCASQYKGAWWYYDCYSSNLNGLYLPGKDTTQGMVWASWPGIPSYHYSFKRSEMKIRPKDF